MQIFSHLIVALFGVQTAELFALSVPGPSKVWFPQNENLKSIERFHSFLTRDQSSQLRDVSFSLEVSENESIELRHSFQRTSLVPIRNVQGSSSLVLHCSSPLCSWHSRCLWCAPFSAPFNSHLLQKSDSLLRCSLVLQTVRKSHHFHLNDNRHKFHWSSIRQHFVSTQQLSVSKLARR